MQETLPRLLVCCRWLAYFFLPTRQEQSWAPPLRRNETKIASRLAHVHAPW